LVDVHFAISFEAAGEVSKPSSQTAPCRKTAAKKGARKRGQKAGGDREAPAARAHAAPTAFVADQRFLAVFERILHTRHFQAWPDLDDVLGDAPVGNQPPRPLRSRLQKEKVRNMLAGNTTSDFTSLSFSLSCLFGQTKLPYFSQVS
jgi:hypothetical protein